MTKVTKKKNRKLRRQIRKTVGALFMISAIVVAAVPVPDVSANVADPVVRVAVVNYTDSNMNAYEKINGKDVPSTWQSQVPYIGDDAEIYTTGDRMYQFFVKEEQIGKDFITITGPDVNHMKNVLRMKPGEAVRISSDTGKSYQCSVLELTDTFIQLDILDSEIAGTELPNRIFLFQALPKGDRMEYIIQKAVELGVYEIIPVVMKYCVVKLDPKKAKAKVARWQAVAESAAKQSKRSRIPTVHPLMHFQEAAAYAMQCGCRLVPYENERGMQATAQALQTIQPGTSVSIMIGPEGGFSAEEIDALRNDMQIISLGKRILRTDTAAIAMMSLLMLHIEIEHSEAGYDTK